MLTSLRAIIRGAARSLGMQRAAHAALIEEMWADIVGPVAAGHSRFVSVRGTTVLAETEAGPWIQELSAQRGRFVAEINRRLGGPVVAEIRFRPAVSRLPAGGGVSGGSRDGAEGRGPGEMLGGSAEGGDSPLSPEEMAAVEQAVAEIRDPEIREGARRAMVSQLRWRRRHPPG